MSPWQIVKCDDSQNYADITPANVASENKNGVRRICPSCLLHTNTYSTTRC